MFKLTVTPKSPNTVHISWFPTVGAPLAKLSAVLLRSESRFGPYDPVGEAFDPIQTPEVVDNAPQLKPLRRWYYRLQITNAGHMQEFPPVGGVSTERRDDPEARIMAGDSELRYRDHGRALVYFPARTHGLRCPRCFDTATGARLDTNCTACFGTTFASAYLTPIRLWVMLEHLRVQTSSYNASGTPMAPTTARIRAPWFVDLKPGDIFVDDDGLRWEVASDVHRIMKRGCTIRSECTVSMVQPGSVKYSLPVPAEVFERQKGWQYTPPELL